MNNQQVIIKNEDKFRMTKIVIEESIGNIAMFKAMNDIVVGNDNYILIHQTNNSALISAIRFCNIFGSNSEDNHWKNFFSGEEINNQIREKVILKVFRTIEEWEDYYKGMMDFRNNFVVHHSINGLKEKIKVPNFEIAFMLLEKYYYFILKNIWKIEKIQIVNTIDMMFKKVYDDTIDLYKRVDQYE